MGDPRKSRKKYSTPNHPWRRERIEEEKALLDEYGFKNRKEIWKMKSFLANAKRQVKTLGSLSGKHAEMEEEQLLAKLQKYGLIDKSAQLTSVLSLSTKNVLERRLQTIVHRKGLAKSMKQARQFIVHGHIVVNGTKLTVPSYLVPVAEEGKIEFRGTSALSSPEHAERATPAKPQKPKKQEVRRQDGRRPRREMKHERR